jgi:hypothetical protein
MKTQNYGQLILPFRAGICSSIREGAAYTTSTVLF